jgi:ribose 1,5-bisphosphokinase PhnN
VFCGYVPDHDVGVTSGSGWWALLKNSWNIRWGVRGYAFVAPKAIDQMIRHPHTVMVGRSDMQSPRARRSKFDFTKKSILR